MLKRVTNSRDVAHLWANEVQSEARNGRRSMSFDGGTLYSYNAPIGRVVKNRKGERAFYLNSHTYSITTTRHQSHARQAIPDDAVVFYFDFTGGESEGEILSQFRALIADYVGKAKRARTHKAQNYRYALNSLWRAEAFCRFYGIRKKVLPAKARQELLNATDDAEAAEESVHAAARAAAEAKQAKQNAERREKYAAALEEWKLGISGHPSYLWADVFPTALRVNGDNVETSRGASVPLAVALRVWNAYKAGKDIRGENVGGYGVRRVDAESVYIGCHIIPLAEAVRVLG